METERILTKASELKNFEMLAKILTYNSKNNRIYVVDDVYFDYGLNWMWTTIIRVKTIEDENGTQVLSPRVWKQVISATTIEEIVAIAREMETDKYWGDK